MAVSVSPNIQATSQQQQSSLKSRLSSASETQPFSYPRYWHTGARKQQGEVPLIPRALSDQVLFHPFAWAASSNTALRNYYSQRLLPEVVSSKRRRQICISLSPQITGSSYLHHLSQILPQMSV